MTKDSVELLLEGMAGPRPDRRKTTPQSDGEASASYHAEHGLRRARTSEPAGPKVVVERPTAPRGALEPPAPAKAPGQVPGPKAPPGSRESLSTFVPARVLRRRVAMALVAGVLIVLLSFMTLRLTGKPRDAEGPAGAAEMLTAPTARPMAATTMPGTVATEAEATGTAAAGTAPGTDPLAPAASAASVAATEAAPVAQVPVAQAPVAQASPVPARTTPATTHHHHHHAAVDRASGEHAPLEPTSAEPAPAEPSASPADLGEFKAKY